MAELGISKVISLLLLDKNNKLRVLRVKKLLKNATKFPKLTILLGISMNLKN